MRVAHFPEPELEFGSGGRHIDVRFGIAQFGPLDRGRDTAPSDLRLGLVGTADTLDGLRAWLDRCRNGVPAKGGKLANLFPAFPGFSADGCFGANLVHDERWTATVHRNEIEALVNRSDASSLSSQAVDLFLAHGSKVLDQGGPDVLICAPPYELLAALESEPQDRKHDPLEDELDEGSEAEGRRWVRSPQFHDLLKARGLALRVPIQMVRPHTYSTVSKGRTRRRRVDQQLQDEATRAWNLHVALYYKAGGIPWRLLRDPAELTTCFVGVSFYRTPAGDRLLTSVAHVFNERGEGTIVRGGDAEFDKDDLQPHLSEEDSRNLLVRAIRAYRREHKTQPARVALHKTSRFSAAERDGFRAAASEERIDTVDLLSVRRSFTRLFREGSYPPLRGTWLQLDDRAGLLYLRGSVEFFRTYPGMYVPRPIEYFVEQTNTAARQLAAEMMSLSKLNWNNTQFDGGEPITVRAARRVGDILKHVQEPNLEASFRFFI